MKIYLVRHGETNENRLRIHQGYTVSLNERGRMQSLRAAEMLAHYPITKIIASDLTRAKESAAIIGAKLNLPVEESRLFREVERPSVLCGTHHYSIKTAFVGCRMMLHLKNPVWHHSDEENLFDVKGRIQAAVTYLDSLKDSHEHVAVVSHAFMLNLFLRYMCDGGEVRVRDYLATLLLAKRLKNGSITVVTYEDDHNPYTCDFETLEYNR